MSNNTQSCPFAGAEFGERFRPFEQEGMFEFLKEARDSQPVFYNKELDVWVLTKKADIQAVFRDPDHFSAQNAQAPITGYSTEVVNILKEGGFTREPTQTNADRPKHTRIRNIAGQFLNMKNFNQYEAEIREMTEREVATLDGKNRVDLVAALTYELPAKVLFRIVGVPEEASAQVKAWGENRFNMIWGKPTEAEMAEGAEGVIEYWNFCKGIVAKRQKEGLGTDYVSHLLRLRDGDDSVLTMNELHSMVHGVLLAGHETTSNGSANMLWALLSDREQWQKVVDDPALIPNTIEEGLRFMTPFITWRRMALTEVEVGGVTIPEGATILMSLVSANHDEEQFECPMKFDVERKNARQHLAFGNGIHFCMGAPLARLEMKILLEELTKRFPKMKLAEDLKVEWAANMGFRGPVRLMVDLQG